MIYLVHENYIKLILLWTFLITTPAFALSSIGMKGIGLRGSVEIVGEKQSRFAYGAQADLGEVGPQYRLLVSYERIPGFRSRASDFSHAHVFNIDVLNFGRNTWKGLNAFIGFGLSFQIASERKNVFIGEITTKEATKLNIVPNFILGWHIPFQNNFAWNVEFRANLLGYYDGDIFSILRVHLGFMLYWN